MHTPRLLVTADIEQALIDALEFVERYEDVVDGDYGEPAPNRAMTLAQNLREVLAKLERQPSDLLIIDEASAHTPEQHAALAKPDLSNLHPIFAAAIKPHLHD
jgi:hypothetical protein